MSQDRRSGTLFKGRLFSFKSVCLHGTRSRVVFDHCDVPNLRLRGLSAGGEEG